MSRHLSLRATRPSGPSSHQSDRGGELADRRVLTFWCGSGHQTAVPLAADAELPDSWVCRRCGAPASPEEASAPPTTAAPVFFRTPYEFLMMRRTVEEGEQLLEEALAALKARTGRARTR